MFIPTQPLSRSTGIYGAHPVVWTGTAAVDGDARPWLLAPVGSLYVRKLDSGAGVAVYEKRENEGSDYDWGAMGGLNVIQQTVLFSEFTDGGGASGTKVLSQQIPLGAVVTRTLVKNVVGFTGNTSATVIIGDGTDTDRYNTGTPSVFTTITHLDVGAVSGTAYHAAAKDVTVTVAGATDFTAIAAGQMTVVIFYYL